MKTNFLIFFLLIAFSFVLVSCMSTEVPSKTAMTWGMMKQQDEYVLVSCHGQPVLNGASPSCNAYQGDTSCSNTLPVLCTNPAQLPRPNFLDGTSQYEEWSGAQIHLSQPVKGSALSSQVAADAICSAEFGDGWRMAEFHDGWGWGFWAKGVVPSDKRFWVRINDQPSNCWN